MRNELGRSLPLAALFVLGLAAGIWVFAAPWALGTSDGGWGASTWTTVGVGAVVTLASAISLVVVLARALHLALRQGGGRG